MSEMIVLRLVHVLGGVFWVGAALFNFVFMMPAMQAAGPAAGPVLAALKARRLFLVMPSVAVLTILSGVRLMQITSNGFSANYFESGVGMTFSIAALAALVAFLLGVSIAMPSQKRMAVLGPTIASATDDATRSAAQAEMARLQARMAIVGKVVTALLVIAAAGMGVARYMG